MKKIITALIVLTTTFLLSNCATQCCDDGKGHCLPNVGLTCNYTYNNTHPVKPNNYCATPYRKGTYSCGHYSTTCCSTVNSACNYRGTNYSNPCCPPTIPTQYNAWWY